MNQKKEIVKWIMTGIGVAAICILMIIPLVHAQYWEALPPYNLLWPLWSPVLSPVDPVTGVPTPLVSSITNATVLPVQPALYWDPAMEYAFALYNIPAALGGGLTAFEPNYGLNPWPPSWLVDPGTGAPAPITLPPFFSLLPILDYSDDYTWGNLFYALQFPSVDITSLLTPAQIWGLPPW
jgi:hypothetical protein